MKYLIFAAMLILAGCGDKTTEGSYNTYTETKTESASTTSSVSDSNNTTDSSTKTDTKTDTTSSVFNAYSGKR